MKTSTISRDGILKYLLPLIFWLGVWQAASMAVNQVLLIPSPMQVTQRLGELAMTALFWQSVGRSLVRIFLGAAAGVFFGTAAAVLTHRFRTVNWIVSPVIRLMRTTPVASFIILILLWFPTGQVPGVISCMMVLPVIWDNLSQGIRETDPQLLELARVYRFSRRTVLRRVYLPSVLPYFAGALRTGVGLAWKSGVAAEVLCLPAAAIGTQVYYSKIYLETPSLFAWTAVVILLSLLLEGLVSQLLKRWGGVKG